MVRSLLKSRIGDRGRVVNVLSLLRVCLKQNFFQFNGKYYEQEDALAMGSCLSPFLSDVFMN